MQKPSLLREFTLFVGIVVLSIVFLTGFYAWRMYSDQYTRITALLENTSIRTERSLHQSFQYSNYILDYILSQVEGKWDDLPYIDNLLHTLKVNQDINTIFSWNMFSWSNQYHRVTVNSLHRILPKPVDVSYMSNMAATMAEPGVIQFGKPVYGGISGELVIPASVGAVDEHGRYVGAIGMGFNVDSVLNRLERFIDNSNINYAILDSEYSPVLRSPHEKLSVVPAIISQLKTVNTENNANGILDYYSPFRPKSHYVYYQHIQNTPYTLLFSFNDEVASMEVWHQVSLQLIKFIVIGGVIILLLFLLYQHLIAPITKLSIAADSISHGEPNIIIPTSRHYEISNLAEKLQQVASYVKEIESVKNTLHTQSIALSKAKEDAEKAHREVQEINNSLEQRVAERTKFLHEALAAKQEFLNHLGHEVRTPVSSMQMRIGILLEMWEDFTEEELKESIKNIGSNAFQLCALVTNLLDLFKSNAGKMTYNMQSNDVFAITERVANECLPLYQHKSLTLTVDNTAENTVTLCDAMRISQVVRNLLSNACRYTPSGTVTLSLFNTEMHCDDGRKIAALGLSLKDEGIGVPETETTKIFEAFIQSSKTNNKAGGTGLGLAICLEIISAHHGHIWVENNRDAKGCTFFFTLPLLSA